VAKLHAAPKTGDHDLSDLFVLQIHRPRTSGIQISVNPNERLTRRHLSQRRISRARQTPVQVPCNKDLFRVRVPVRQSPLHYNHEPIVQTRTAVSQRTTMHRDESRRGRHECLRHEVIT
jgi:hypothetical protein